MIKTTAQDTEKVSTKATKVEAPVVQAPVDDIIDIDLAVAKRKKFRLNGDNNLIIELNIADMGIVSRISEATPKLAKLQEKAIKIGEKSAEENEGDATKAIEAFGKDLKEIDKEMRDIIDFVFDADISAKCAKDGTMYDLIDGQFRYDYIIEKFMNLYADNIQKEYKAVRNRVNKYAKKK